LVELLALQPDVIFEGKSLAMLKEIEEVSPNFGDGG
jgi:hypothetical protein